MADSDGLKQAASLLYSAAKRDIPAQQRRDANASSFAGRNRSFPILKRADVMAAVHSMGRAGPDNYDTATLKRNIIRIAKRRGWADALPESWRNE